MSLNALRMAGRRLMQAGQKTTQRHGHGIPYPSKVKLFLHSVFFFTKWISFRLLLPGVHSVMHSNLLVDFYMIALTLPVAALEIRFFFVTACFPRPPF